MAFKGCAAWFLDQILINLKIITDDEVTRCDRDCEKCLCYAEFLEEG